MSKGLYPRKVLSLSSAFFIGNFRSCGKVGGRGYKILLYVPAVRHVRCDKTRIIHQGPNWLQTGPNGVWFLRPYFFLWGFLANKTIFWWKEQFLSFPILPLYSFLLAGGREYLTACTRGMTSVSFLLLFGQVVFLVHPASQMLHRRNMLHSNDPPDCPGWHPRSITWRWPYRSYLTQDSTPSTVLYKVSRKVRTR